MEIHEVVLLKTEGLIDYEARNLLGFGPHDDLRSRVERVKVELQDALDRKGGAVEWRDGIIRALRILD